MALSAEIFAKVTAQRLLYRDTLIFHLHVPEPIT